MEFLRIDHEPAPIPSGVPPAYWPASGSLRVEGLKARYSDGMGDIKYSHILHDADTAVYRVSVHLTRCHV